MKSRSFHKLRLEDLALEENEHYIIVNKPPLLSCLEDRQDQTNLLKLARVESSTLQICHRIDKETSGIVVLAKTPNAYRQFAMQLEQRAIKKVYHAVIDAIASLDLEADEPIYSSTNKSKVDFKRGKPSLTLIKTLEIFKKHSLVKCFPVSGRMHQIRAHLAFHQVPITQDLSYGGAMPLLSKLKKNYRFKEDVAERPMISRMALHAQAITFRLPAGDVLDIYAPYPHDFELLIQQLRKYT